MISNGVLKWIQRSLKRNTAWGSENSEHKMAGKTSQGLRQAHVNVLSEEDDFLLDIDKINEKKGTLPEAG